MLGYQTGIVILGITVKDKVKSRINTIEKHEYATLSGNFEPFIASVLQKFNLCHWFLKWKDCEDYYSSFDLENLEKENTVVLTVVAQSVVNRRGGFSVLSKQRRCSDSKGEGDRTPSGHY